MQFPPIGQSCNADNCTTQQQILPAQGPIPCPLGYFCRAGVSTHISVPKNYSTPQKCYDGFFCPLGSISPEGSGPCPNGYFCPNEIDALPCPPGTQCPGVGNTGPVDCNPGSFNPSYGQGNCTACPVGFICPGWAGIEPEICPAGFVCSSLGLSFPVVVCPQGYYCLEGTRTEDPSASTPYRPHPCQSGAFCLGGVASQSVIEWIPSQTFGVNHPQDCTEGTYCKEASYEASGTGLCFPGHYCPPKSSYPTVTPLGNFASGVGSVAPTVCFPGTYAPLVGQIVCSLCPAGHTCNGYGTYIPSICPAGTYRMQVDSIGCVLCQTGTYSFETGAPDISSCLPCPKGRICGIQGMSNLSSSTFCPAGYHCGYGTDRSRQVSHSTPAGSYSYPGSTAGDAHLFSVLLIMSSSFLSYIFSVLHIFYLLCYHLMCREG